MSSQMEKLSNDFNNLLYQYKDVYQKFLDTVNSGNNNLTPVPNSAFIGQSNINIINGSSINNCLVSCNSNENCSGATFDNNLNTCTLSKGNGRIISSKNQTAIVRQALYYTNQLQQINNKLTEINKSMINNSSSNLNLYSQTQQKNNEKSNILNQNYQTLQQERLLIDDMVLQYETLNSALENGNINVTSNYYKYIMYLIIAVLLLFLLMRINLNIEQRGGGITNKPNLIYIFLIIVIIFNAFIKN
jgi:hypothetical protein